jgi:hypothetical protein
VLIKESESSFGDSACVCVCVVRTGEREYRLISDAPPALPKF